MFDVVREALASQLAELTREVATPTARLGYGVDLVCVDDITIDARETDPESYESLAQDLYHRITTRRGMIPDDPDWGIDVRSYLHRGTTLRELAAMAGEIGSELRKDDRVQDVTVTIVAGTLGKSLDIKIRVTPEDPARREFDMLLAVTDAAVLLSLEIPT